MQEKPCPGRIRPVPAYDPDGFLRYLLNFGVESGDRWLIQSAGQGAGVETDLPKDFVGHPVADSGKKLLQQKKGFQGCAPAFRKNSLQSGYGKFPAEHRGLEGRPPSGSLTGAFKPDSSKETRILEH